MDSISVLIGLICIACSSHGSLAARHGKGIEVYCEGREAVLSFVFPGKISNVELRRGNRAPFYDSGQLLETGLSQDQVNRFQVRPHINNTHYVLILTISNVSQGDGGTYMGLAYTNGDKETAVTKKVALVIQYPPGDPQCKVIFHSNVGVIYETWDIIECTADIGTMPGYIACFQNNVASPVHGDLITNSTTLSQRLWARRGQMISCCSTDFRSSVNAKSCTAYQMGNTFLTTSHSKMNMQSSLITENYEATSMSTPSTESISKRDLTGIRLSFTELVIFLILLTIIVLFVLILIKKHKRENVSANNEASGELLMHPTESTQKCLDKSLERDKSSERKEELLMEAVKTTQELLDKTVEINASVNDTIQRHETLLREQEATVLDMTMTRTGRNECGEARRQSGANLPDVSESGHGSYCESWLESSQSTSTLKEDTADNF